MSLLADVQMYARFAWGLRGYLGHKLTLEEARSTVRRRLAERETNFLRLVEKGIFGYARSPYRPLLENAGVELGDIRNMLGEKGLEGTLLSLRQAGVYYSFEEFKGREPVVRDGRIINVRPADFDNPYLSHSYRALTGASTGTGTRVNMDLERIADGAVQDMLMQSAHDVLDAPTVLWRGILPDSTGLVNVLQPARFSHVPVKWFSPITGQGHKPALKNRLATALTISLGQLYGIPIPKPEPLSLDEAEILARWVSRTLEESGKCLIRTSVSMALRVSLAAQEAGLDLTGAMFMGASEPPTPAKVKRITDSGARYTPNYVFTEAGRVGGGCARPSGVNDLHFFNDHLALISFPRRVPGFDITVDAFHFTTLLPSAIKILLNVESDDYGILETRSCGCPLEEYGFAKHVRDIRSFRKLTGEGVTLIGSEMVAILEQVLPERFGGSPLSYQLWENEDEQGFTRLDLLISPSVDIQDEDQVIQVMLESLQRSSVSADLARDLWSQASSLRIRRMEPVWTARGKLMPLHIAERFKQ
ncbi:MAG: hypothetical protein JXA42_02200 [Anaerolineales bacterium]|nr:hypothetical protein [Anaerolineales bacterium]